MRLLLSEADKEIIVRVLGTHGWDIQRKDKRTKEEDMEVLRINNIISQVVFGMDKEEVKEDKFTMAPWLEYLADDEP
tara:strand:+ start:454 stop:684 length:231 start_codon:yes stop_codon:yes gene_type:complete